MNRFVIAKYLLVFSLVAAGIAPSRELAAQTLPPGCRTMDLHAFQIPALQQAVYGQRQKLESFLAQIESRFAADRRALHFVALTRRYADRAFQKEQAIIAAFPRPVVFCNDESVCGRVDLVERLNRFREQSARLRDTHVLAGLRYGEALGRIFEIDYANSAFVVVVDALDYFPPAMHRCRA